MELSDALWQGQALLGRLEDGHALQHYGRQLLSIARDERRVTLIAASAPAHRLVAAALVMSHGSDLPAMAPGDRCTALICDVMLSSGDSLRRAARRARGRGATRVVAVVMADPWGDGATRVPEVDELRVMDGGPWERPFGDAHAPGVAASGAGLLQPVLTH